MVNILVHSYILSREKLWKTYFCSDHLVLNVIWSCSFQLQEEYGHVARTYAKLDFGQHLGQKKVPGQVRVSSFTLYCAMENR